MLQSFATLVELFERSCATYASRPLYGTKRDGAWQWTTYREVHDMVERCRGGLAALGVGPGDRVAMLSDNRVEWAVAAYATYGLEAAFVPTYQAQRRQEREYILRDSGAKVAIAATEAVRQEVEAMKLPELENVIGLEQPASQPSAWSALLDVGARFPTPARSPSASAVANFVYTSGTTGKPKGVLLSHGNVASNVAAVHEIFTVEPDDRSLCFLPWAHVYGQLGEVHWLISTGCSAALNDDLANLLTNLTDVKPTILFAVPRIFNRIYEGVNDEIARRPGVLQRMIRGGIRGAIKRTRGEPIDALERVELALDETLVFGKIRARFGGHLKYVISGSAPLGHDVAEFIDALGIPVYEAYGLTETSPLVSANVPGEGRRRLGSVGRVVPGVRVVIDSSVGDDPTCGEIVVYGPNVMLGYHNRPEETARALTSDGGLRTGDLGYVDGDGFLFVTGRIKEQYKLENGKYVMPSVLEEELKLSPFVANVMIYGDGRPFNVALVVIDEKHVRAWAEHEGWTLEEDPTRDERVKALVRNEIELHAREFKPFEKPRELALLREDFTMSNGLLTPTLKVRRRDVVARYAALLESLYRAPAG